VSAKPCPGPEAPRCTTASISYMMDFCQLCWASLSGGKPLCSGCRHRRELRIIDRCF
jgi:hypothetical protein